ncbi:MAG: 16S rRNA (guanine(527)-N(7))-methyltransferase RsmG [Gammaproteobacteria bacterium]|nr:16S rRNA (guanine(527)-N(7))-methyltransferase RsmG [Gammaproteobacteria bacterium]
MQIVDLIRAGLSQFSFPTDDELTEKSAAFIEQLARWNKIFNLTAIRRPGDMVVHHLLDSLSIAPYLPGTRIIDVGSGAGLPGIPLAILYPGKNFILLDSNGKKTRFMTQVAIELELSNVAVVQSRVEQYRDQQFDHVLCRAFAPLAVIAEKVSHLVRNQGNVLAMKGKYNEDPEPEPSSKLQVHQVIPISVPLLDADRCLVELKYRNNT